MKADAEVKTPTQDIASLPEELVKRAEKLLQSGAALTCQL